ncbi:MAG: hypothetical protein R3F19_16855 [Verrucomicrobiales bacterium]
MKNDKSQPILWSSAVMMIRLAIGRPSGAWTNATAWLAVEL